MEVAVGGVAGEDLRQTKGIALRRVRVKSFQAKGIDMRKSCKT